MKRCHSGEGQNPVHRWNAVIPAKAGIQALDFELDSGLRRNDLYSPE
jgi:hypothetical protein